jgi:hypothetical protein
MPLSLPASLAALREAEEAAAVPWRGAEQDEEPVHAGRDAVLRAFAQLLQLGGGTAGEARGGAGLLPVLIQEVRECAAEPQTEDEDAHATRAQRALYAAAMVLSGTPEPELDAVFRGAAVAALALARRHAGDALVVAYACNFINNGLTASPARRDAACSLGALELGVGALQQHPRHPLVAVHACAMLGGCASGDPVRRAAAGEAGVVEAVARVLADVQSTCDAQTAAAAASVFINCCLRVPANRARAWDAGALDTLVAALRTHVRDSKAVAALCKAVCNIVGDDDGDVRGAASAVAAGALPAVAAALRAHPADASVHDDGAGVLVNTLSMFQAAPDVRRAALHDAPDLLPALAECIRHGVQHPEALRVLSIAVQYVCQNAPDLAAAATDAGVAAALVAALAATAPGAASDAVVHEIIVAFSTLMHPGGASRQGAPMLAALVGVAQRFGARSLVVAEPAQRLMLQLLREDMALRATPLAGDAITAAVAMAAHHPDDPAVAGPRYALPRTMAAQMVLDAQSAVVTAAALRAGLLPLMEAGPLRASHQATPEALEAMRQIVMARLRAAAVVNDAARCAEAATCARCAQLRDAGQLPACTFLGVPPSRVGAGGPR